VEIQDDILLGTESAAEYLRGRVHGDGWPSKGTLAEWRARHTPNTPRFTRIGRRVLYPRSALDDFLASLVQRAISP